jgi:hypothetical protein
MSALVEKLPEFFGCGDIPWVAASHGDDGNRFAALLFEFTHP